jgi:hypothetical protein
MEQYELYTMGWFSEKPACMLETFARTHPADALRVPAGCNAGINRSNTAVQVVLKQMCSTSGWKGTV